MELTKQEVEVIVERVLNNVSAVTSSNVEKPKVNPSMKALTPSGLGVYEEIEDAIFNAQDSYVQFNTEFRLEDRNRIIEAIRSVTLENVEMLATLMYEETGLGRLEDKKSKIILAATKTPGTEDLKTDAVSGDYGLTIEERAPFGLIGAVTPVTNPVETIVSNAISMIAAGNAVVFNVHPSAKKSSAKIVTMINEASISVGGPSNLCTMVKNPSLKTLDKIIACPHVRMLVGTGGTGLVKTLLQSGKKAVGAGAGNPPVIVDNTADVKHAAKAIVEGASFDNNLLCIAEKVGFVQEDIYDQFVYELLQNDVYILNHEEVKKIRQLVLTTDEEIAAKGCTIREIPKYYHVKKEWVGKDASEILKQIGVDKPSVKLIVYEAIFEDPLVHLEQMMPVLPILKFSDFDQAVKQAVEVESGNRHTASIFSKNTDNMTKFARAIQTTIFVKNEATLAGVGFRGEGHATFTIAGPTGEGITSARTFTRIRRCVLAEGGFRLV